MKITLLATLLLTLAGLNASAGIISLVPSKVNPAVGDTFTIDLRVTSNTDEIEGFGLDYSIGTAAIGLTGVAINPFFGTDLGLGNPQLSAITFPGATTPSVTLVSFTFHANSAGSSVFSVFSDLNDPNQGLFLVNKDAVDLDTQVTINVLAAVPEPSTFGFGAIAVTGLFFAARRRAVI